MGTDERVAEDGSNQARQSTALVYVSCCSLRVQVEAEKTESGEREDPPIPMAERLRKDLRELVAALSQLVRNTLG